MVPQTINNLEDILTGCGEDLRAKYKARDAAQMALDEGNATVTKTSAIVAAQVKAMGITDATQFATVYSILLSLNADVQKAVAALGPLHDAFQQAQNDRIAAWNYFASAVGSKQPGGPATLGGPQPVEQP